MLPSNVDSNDVATLLLIVTSPWLHVCFLFGAAVPLWKRQARRFAWIPRPLGWRKWLTGSCPSKYNKSYSTRALRCKSLLSQVYRIMWLKELSFDTKIDGSFSCLVSAAEDAEQMRRDEFHESELFSQDTNQQYQNSTYLLRCWSHRTNLIHESHSIARRLLNILASCWELQKNLPSTIMFVSNMLFVGFYFACSYIWEVLIFLILCI